MCAAGPGSDFAREIRDVYTGARRFSIATPRGAVQNLVTSDGLELRFRPTGVGADTVERE